MSLLTLEASKGRLLTAQWRLNRVPDLQKQGTWTPGSWALSRTPSLPSATQASRGPRGSFAPACGPLNWMLRVPRLREGRGVSTVGPRCLWSEAPWKDPQRSLLQPSVSLQETSWTGSQGPRENPVCRGVSQGLIHPFPTCSCKLADDSGR